MLIRKTKEETRKVEVVIESYYQCDKCGNTIKNEMFDAFEFDFDLRIGEIYPEGGHGMKYSLDLCPECSIKLISLLEEHQFNFRVEEWRL